MANANTVILSTLPAKDSLIDSCAKIKLNGLNVTVGPCTSSDAPGVALYLIPALRLRAEGTGTSDENVTEPGAGTTARRVLHTICPAYPRPCLQSPGTGPNRLEPEADGAVSRVMALTLLWGI